jgi:hypothetical protein
VEKVLAEKYAQKQAENINKAIEICKPYLYDFPGVKSLREELNCCGDVGYMGYYEYVTDDRLVQCPKGISLRTRCLTGIINLGGVHGFLDERKNNGEGLNGDKRIFIAENGKVLLAFERHYDVYYYAYGKDYPGRRYVTVECKISVLNESRLVKLIENQLKEAPMDMYWCIDGRVIDELLQANAEWACDKTKVSPEISNEVEAGLKKIQRGIKRN